MPRIPRYQQNQIASQVVGTPGLSSSTSNLMGELASQANRLNSSLFQVAFQEARQERLQENALAQLEKARQQRVASIAINKEQLQYSAGLDQQFKDLRQQNVNSPDQIIPQAQEIGQRMLDEQLESITDPIVRDKVQAGALGILRGKLGGLTGQVERLENQKAVADLEQQFDTIIVQAGNGDSSEAFESAMATFADPRTVEDALFVYGAEAPKKIREAQGDAIDQRIKQLIGQRDFAAARELVDDERFDKILSAEDRLKSKKEIQSVIDAEERRELRQIRKQQDFTRLEVATTIAEATAANAPIIEQLDMRKEALRNELAKPKNEQDRVLIDQLRRDIGGLTTAQEKKEEKEAEPSAVEKGKTAATLNARYIAIQQQIKAALKSEANEDETVFPPSAGEMTMLYVDMNKALKKGLITPSFYKQKAGNLKYRISQAVEQLKRTNPESFGQLQPLDLDEGQSFEMNNEKIDKIDNDVLKYAKSHNIPDDVMLNAYAEAELVYKQGKGIPVTEQLNDQQVGVLFRLINKKHKAGEL